MEWQGFIWYLIVCASVVFYAVLDGFDLGIGALQLCARKDEERRIFLNAIGPVWDGNEVWLVIIAGALFAGFSRVYATLFSAFYTLNMVLLAGVIFRAVAIEFRSKLVSPRWRSLWDGVFCISSIVMSLTMGILLGNLVEGIPLNAEGDFIGDLSSFFSPYSLLSGVTILALFVMHGAIFLVMKTEGVLHDKIRAWVNIAIVVFVIFYVMLTLSTILYQPHMVERMKDSPYLFAISLVAMLSIANIPREMHKGRDGWAFVSSIVAISTLFGLFGLGTFPVLVRSSLNPLEHSLTLFNSSPSATTLNILLIIAAIGIPLVLGYGYWIYRIFRGKVRLDSHSY